MRALLTKKILFEEEMYKIKCWLTQLNFIEDLIEFIEGWLQQKKKLIWALIGRN